MTDVIIQGINGRMGRVLQELIAQRNDCRVVAGIDLAASNGDIPVFASFNDLTVKGDVLIDFSAPAATRNAIQYCREHKLPCVICTTGLDAETEAELHELSSHCAVFKSANMSMGINLLIKLAKEASLLLGDAYDVEIVEKHHHNKVDAPSGTALMIADEVNAVNDNKYEYVYDRHSVRQPRGKQEMGISAVRGGSIVGDHDILFCGPNEVITISHSAQSRDVFANGAVNAAVFIADKGPGLYNMADVMEK